jgi:hypothetical protein
VSNNPEDLSARAMEILERLVGEVGPRPAGSPAEKHAQEMIGEALAEKEYRLEWFKVPFRPKEPFLLNNTLVGFGLVLASNDLKDGAGWLALAMPLALAALPELIWLIKRSIPSGGQASSNLLVLPPDTNLEEVDLILAAHVDSARATPASGELWYQWRSQTFQTTLRVAVLLAILALMELLGFSLPLPVLEAGFIITRLLMLVLFIQDIWEQAGSRGKFAPGANDNGSGAAVLTALAESYAAEEPLKAKVAYLFTGAEECGLFGARQFAKHLSELKLKPTVISVDMVGAGWKLKAITGGGRLLRYRTDPQVLELLERADPEIERLHYDRRAGDFEPFVRAGIPAAGIEAAGTKRSWRAYHATTDKLDVIDEEMLTHTLATLRQLVWLVDKNKK